MNITEVKVRLVESGGGNLKAYCSIIIDGEFVVRDVKVVENEKGYLLVMPSRRLTDKCPRCHGKNHLLARFCNDCGKPLPERRAELDPGGRPRLYTDLAHPITAACRKLMHDRVLEEFHAELERDGGPPAGRSRHGGNGGTGGKSDRARPHGGSQHGSGRMEPADPYAEQYEED